MFFVCILILIEGLWVLLPNTTVCKTRSLNFLPVQIFCICPELYLVCLFYSGFMLLSTIFQSYHWMWQRAQCSLLEYASLKYHNPDTWHIPSSHITETLLNSFSSTFLLYQKLNVSAKQNIIMWPCNCTYVFAPLVFAHLHPLYLHICTLCICTSCSCRFAPLAFAHLHHLYLHLL